MLVLEQLPKSKENYTRADREIVSHVENLNKETILESSQSMVDVKFYGDINVITFL